MDDIFPFLFTFCIFQIFLKDYVLFLNEKKKHYYEKKSS